MFNKTTVIVGNGEQWWMKCASLGKEVGTMGIRGRKEVKNVDFVLQSPQTLKCAPWVHGGVSGPMPAKMKGVAR